MFAPAVSPLLTDGQEILSSPTTRPNPTFIQAAAVPSLAATAVGICSWWENAQRRARLPYPHPQPWLGIKTPAEHWVRARVSFGGPVYTKKLGLC